MKNLTKKEAQQYLYQCEGIQIWRKLRVRYTKGLKNMPLDVAKRYRIDRTLRFIKEYIKQSNRGLSHIQGAKLNRACRYTIYDKPFSEKYALNLIKKFA